MSMKKAKIYIGTSGWSYKHWRERFYPADLQPTEYLHYYHYYFPVAEINTSFYHLPTPSAVESWAGQVSEPFRFCPKISRFITHIKKLNDPEQTLPRFFDVFDGIQHQLGPVLLQLPPNLAYHADKVRHFFELLTMYKDYSFAIEPRHASWLEEDAINLLKEFEISFVIADSGQRWPSGEFITAGNVYLRFHGPDGSYAKSSSSQVLQEYAHKILQWYKNGHTVWAFFDNDGNGYAVRNAQALIDML